VDNGYNLGLWKLDGFFLEFCLIKVENGVLGTPELIPLVSVKLFSIETSIRHISPLLSPHRLCVPILLAPSLPFGKNLLLLLETINIPNLLRWSRPGPVLAQRQQNLFFYSANFLKLNLKIKPKLCTWIVGKNVTRLQITIIQSRTNTRRTFLGHIGFSFSHSSKLWGLLPPIVLHPPIPPHTHTKPHRVPWILLSFSIVFKPITVQIALILRVLIIHLDIQNIATKHFINLAKLQIKIVVRHTEPFSSDGKFIIPCPLAREGVSEQPAQSF
jgi:hypothetical protein